jgi:hypothetical protein
MTFRPLLIFWAIILSLAAATAVTLQLLGPPQFRAAPSLAPAVRPHVPPAPAQISPSRVDPAPRLRMTGQAIPEPDPPCRSPRSTTPTG